MTLWETPAGSRDRFPGRAIPPAETPRWAVSWPSRESMTGGRACTSGSEVVAWPKRPAQHGAHAHPWPRPRRTNPFWQVKNGAAAPIALQLEAVRVPGPSGAGHCRKASLCISSRARASLRGSIRPFDTGRMRPSCPCPRRHPGFVAGRSARTADLSNPLRPSGHRHAKT